MSLSWRPLNANCHVFLNIREVFVSMADETETSKSVSEDTETTVESKDSKKAAVKTTTKKTTRKSTKKDTEVVVDSDTKAEDQPETKPKKKTTRKSTTKKKTTKSKDEESSLDESSKEEVETKEVDAKEEEPKPKTRTRRTRTTKAKEVKEADTSTEEEASKAESTTEEEAPKKTVRRRRTTKKATKDTEAKEETKAEEDSSKKVEEAVSESKEEETPKTTKRRRVTRRKTTKTEDASSASDAADDITQITSEATTANPVPTSVPSQVLDVEDLKEIKATANVQEEDTTQPRPRRTRRVVADDSDVSSKKSNNDTNNNNRNKQTKKKEQGQEPSLSREYLTDLKVTELREKARELNVEFKGVKKADLIELVYNAAAEAEGFRHFKGVLEIQNDGYGFVRAENYMQGEHDSFVFQQIIKQYRLRNGDELEGTTVPPRNKNSFPPVHNIEKINGRDPEITKTRARFKDLTPIYPKERLIMECGKDSITGRAIDLVAPIGKGQRGLIVSPPKAGKTTVLKHLCQSIAKNNPEVHLICLLVDERPEEVTDMQRSIKGEVVASTFDMPAENHTTVSELVMERAKRLVEQGDDVVVVLDSITRLARAYNITIPASGRVLSGGVDSAALYPPKKFLGAARNIEGGGSLTILASALVDTGSKMDEVIFEEFKGTGNMELKLDRSLADRRIYPAIDPIASGTRNEDLLLDDMTRTFVWGIRRSLAEYNDTERAATSLIKGLKQTKSNQEFLIRAAKKAQKTDF